MEEFTYEQIRAKALRQGVKDNKVHIGLWANLNNYLKTRRKKNGNTVDFLWNTYGKCHTDDRKNQKQNS